ncbi:DUF4199 family protein [Chitinophaga pendula]|uniref:DUF4199 family protein n=1 Tax=Chitinophaga TaxID=79328 RepID=UPI000BAF5AE1|nr:MULTISPECIES: DUF4199 family protein [Chitinophaga]ASZ10597.1 hypothetical protein CK934_06205 [Chitinophaga sp. MD30]UCJ06427.1 DUF4199 family protein [Chitinophaga pendula]
METGHAHTKLSPIYGIGIAAVSIVFIIIFYATQVYGNLWTGYFVNLIVFLGVLFSVIHYNSQHHERTSSQALFAAGFRTTLLSVVIISVFTIVVHLVTQEGAQRNMITADDRPQGVDMQHNFWIYMLTNVFFTSLILGVLASIISALVFKRNQQSTKGERPGNQDRP